MTPKDSVLPVSLFLPHNIIIVKSGDRSFGTHGLNVTVTSLCQGHKEAVTAALLMWCHHVVAAGMPVYRHRHPHLHPTLTHRLHGVVLRVCLEYGRLRVHAAAESHLRKGQSGSCHARRLTSQLTVTGSVLGQLTLCQLTVSAHCDRVSARTADSLSADCVSSL